MGIVESGPSGRRKPLSASPGSLTLGSKHWLLRQAVHLHDNLIFPAVCTNVPLYVPRHPQKKGGNLPDPPNIVVPSKPA